MIEQKIRQLDEMLTIQEANIVVGGENDPYMLGMYNGMEFARSILTGGEPVYMNKDGRLDPEAKDRNVERYI